MGLRIIDTKGGIADVIPFSGSVLKVITLCCDLQTSTHKLDFGKRFIKKPKPNRHSDLFIVETSLPVFQTIALTGNEALREFYQSVRKGKSTRLTTNPLPLDLSMQHCISSMRNYTGSSENKNTFLFSKVIELLWLQQENIFRSREMKNYFVKTEYDIERITFARDYLLTHLDAPPTLQSLASIAGINEFKLKHGFKELFNQPVFTYLANIRLEMAQRALREKKKTITQIAFELGYASLQHFSKAFKDKFGVSPLRYRGNNFHK